MDSAGNSQCQEPDISVSIIGTSTFLELERCLEATEGLSDMGAVPLQTPVEEGSASNNVSDLELFDSGGNDAAAEGARKHNCPLAAAELPEGKEAKLDVISSLAAADAVGPCFISDSAEQPDNASLRDVQITPNQIPLESTAIMNRDEAHQTADQSAHSPPRPSYPLGHILRPLVSAKPEFGSENFLRGCKW